MTTTTDSMDVCSFGNSSKSYVAGLPTKTFAMSGTFDSTSGSLPAEFTQMHYSDSTQPYNDARFFTLAEIRKLEELPLGTYPRLSDSETTEDTRSEMILWEYAVTYTPHDASGNLIDGASKILIEPKTMLAQTRAAVERVAAREVQDDGTLNWDDVNIIVTRFED